MPFVSKAQMGKCFALKARGQAKGWNCTEWAHATKNIKSLPEHKGGGTLKAHKRRHGIS